MSATPTARSVLQTDAGGATTRFAYDPLGRLTARELSEPGRPQPLAWQYYYYNQNGELVWNDGPRYDPEDYIWRDYDGAGRTIQEVRWRSRGRLDGRGVEAEAPDALWAVTSCDYDGFGNPTKQTDPRGHFVRRDYDALERVACEVFCDQTGLALATNGFAYEPGGFVRRQTNALGAVTEMAYTATGKLKQRKNADD